MVRGKELHYISANKIQVRISSVFNLNYNGYIINPDLFITLYSVSLLTNNVNFNKTQLNRYRWQGSYVADKNENSGNVYIRVLCFSEDEVAISALNNKHQGLI